MAIPRSKSAPNSPLPSSSSPEDNPSVKPSVNPSADADTDKTSKATVDKVVTKDEIKVEQPDPVSAPSSSPATSPAPHPAVTVPSPAAAAVPVSDDDLPSILRRLTPIQRAKLRSAAISEGVIQSGIGSGRENPDGSLSVMIRVDGDLVPQLRTWAEEAGKPVQEQVREIVDMLLNSYLLSPWEPPQPIGAPAAAATANEPVAK